MFSIRGSRIVVLGSLLLSLVSSCYLSDEVTRSADPYAGNDVDSEDGGNSSRRQRDSAAGRPSEEEDCLGKLDCRGICNGNAVEDDNGDCCGPDEIDCNNICNGPGVVYNRRACCASGVFDCLGVCDGTAVEDACGDCCEPDELDCRGICGGTAVEDDNGDCCEPNELDCMDVCGGTAIEDNEGDCCKLEDLDCNDICNGPGMLDGEICCASGDFDCSGRCDGLAVQDANGACCQPEDLDCSDICNGDAVEDRNGVCCEPERLNCEGICQTSDSENVVYCCESEYPADFDYPPRYIEPDDAQALFDANVERFTETTHYCYTVTGHPITWTPDIQNVGGSLYTLSDEEDLTDEKVRLIAERFINSEWSGFFGTEGVTLDPYESLCFDTFCRVQFEQDYCGLRIVTDDLSYAGNMRVEVRTVANPRLQDLTSSLVPMMPVHLVPSIDKEAAVQALIGKNFVVSCPDSDISNEITADLGFLVDYAPVLYLRAVDDHSLEYRLAYAILFGPLIDGNFNLWTADLAPLPEDFPLDLDFIPVATGYVDAVDGSFLSTVSNIICM
jgi:hypothetical protein